MTSSSRNVHSIGNYLLKKSWLAALISIAGGFLYAIQIWIYAYSQDSFLDEGNYLLKGYWFATGEYTPFEPYGPWTNKMPLSFLIPGYVQKVFGPGLRTGRYYAIVVAFLFLIGVWIVTHRLGGRWGATGAMIIIAFNPAPLKVYSMVLSEGLIATMLVWVLVFILGKDHPLWQVLLGAFLAGLIPITRLNMSPVLPFTLGYIFWEHGVTAGLLSSLASAVSFVGGFFVFWPGIMGLLTPWIPEKITPFLDNWRPDFGGAQSSRFIDRSLRERYMSFFEGLRYHLPAIMGSVASWIFWPEKWEDRSEHRTIVYLSSLFVVLFGIHAYASLLMDYNVFAFSLYLSFFEVLGILILLISIRNWKLRQPAWKQVLIFSLVLLVSAGIIFSYAGMNTFWGKQVGLFISKRSFHIQKGKLTRAPWRIWETIHHWIGWEYRTSIIVGTVFLLLGFEVAILGGVVWLCIKTSILKTNGRLASVVVMGFLVLSALLSPTQILGGGMKKFICRKGVIAQHEQAAELISNRVEKGDNIYWVGVDTQVILLELIDKKQVSLYPQQLNSFYSYKFGGVSDALEKHGFWNETSSKRWLAASDVFLLEKQAADEWFQNDLAELDLKNFKFVEKTGPIGCIAGKQITIYRRMP